MHGELNAPAVADDSASLTADVVGGPPPSRRGHHRPDARGSDAPAVAAAASLAADMVGGPPPSREGPSPQQGGAIPPLSRGEFDCSRRRRRRSFALGSLARADSRPKSAGPGDTFPVSGGVPSPTLDGLNVHPSHPTPAPIFKCVFLQNVKPGAPWVHSKPMHRMRHTRLSR